MATVAIAKGMFNGNKDYQIQARRALPILVRQARQAQTALYYEDLAAELGMPNPRNLNYVLGSVGQTLLELGRKWKSEHGREWEEIPRIQALVCNKTDGVPGEGIEGFLSEDYARASRRQKIKIIDSYLVDIYTYEYWDEVLDDLGLEPLDRNFTEDVSILDSANTGGGESEAHKQLKEYVLSNPSLIGIKHKIQRSGVEHKLPSGDSLDVYFACRKIHIGVEVKSSVSNDEDILRGLYQCVKYQAVLEAQQTVENTKVDIRCVLVLEAKLPQRLLPVKNMLNVEVVDDIRSE